MIHPDSHRSKTNAVKIAQKWTAIMPALLVLSGRFRGNGWHWIENFQILSRRCPVKHISYLEMWPVYAPFIPAESLDRTARQGRWPVKLRLLHPVNKACYLNTMAEVSRTETHAWLNEAKDSPVFGFLFAHACKVQKLFEKVSEYITSLTSVRPSAPPKIFKCDAYRIRVWCYVYEFLVSFAVTVRRYISKWRSFYGTMSHQNLYFFSLFWKTLQQNWRR